MRTDGLCHFYFCTRFSLRKTISIYFAQQQIVISYLFLFYLFNLFERIAIALQLDSIWFFRFAMQLSSNKLGIFFFKSLPSSHVFFSFYSFQFVKVKNVLKEDVRNSIFFAFCIHVWILYLCDDDMTWLTITWLHLSKAFFLPFSSVALLFLRNRL